MKKVFMVIAGLFLVGTIILVISISSIVGALIKTGVEKIAPEFTGAPVTLEDVDISLFSTDASIQNLVVSNPNGFKTDFAIKLKEAGIYVDASSLFTDTIVIDEIIIDSPQISYEDTGDITNLSTIMDNIKQSSKSEKSESTESVQESDNTKEQADRDFDFSKDEQATEKGDSQEAKDDEESVKETKVIIKSFIVKNGVIKVTSAKFGTKKISVPLPEVNMENIGEESGGVSAEDALSKIMFEFERSIEKATIAALNDLLIKEGSDRVNSEVNKLNDKLEKKTGVILKDLGGLFGGN